MTRAGMDSRPHVYGKVRFEREVEAELSVARQKFGPIRNLHEGYAVILEELDEFWEDVRSKHPDRLQRAHRELVQVAAMAQRTAEDCSALVASPDPEGPANDRG